MVNRTPPYIQIAEGLRQQIHSGDLGPGDPVPSARDLAAHHEVTTVTVQRAMRVLQQEGLIVSRQGSGTVVATPPARGAQDRARAAVRTGRIYPDGHYARIIKAELVAAPQRIAAVFGLDDGAEAIRRERVTYTADHEVVSTSVSWFDAEVKESAPLLLTTDRVRRGTASYLAGQLGEEISRTVARHGVASATPEHASLLGISVGDPVLISENEFIATDGRVLEFGESVSTSASRVVVESSV